MLGEIAYAGIERVRPQMERAARKIWENPEAGLHEYIASDTIADLLSQNGFKVERAAGGVPTALRAEFGSGHPVIGLLGEFDALPGLSQKDISHREPVVEGGWGHGCGHCLMCPSDVGALIGLRDEMEQKKIPGTIVFYACPAEECSNTKGAMARGGCFKELDIALCWHPGKYNRSSYSWLTGTNSLLYKFHGKAAHAACNPELGRSALDAVELMNVGVNYLREHVPQDVRMHYCIVNGGAAPNVVPDYAAVKYTLRAMDINNIHDVVNRVQNIAQGAALMTGTSVEVENYGGGYPVMNNHVVADTIDEAMREIPYEEWSEEDIAYARELNNTIPGETAASVAAVNSPADTQLHVGVAPIDTENDYGSSDIGDISHICPTCFYKGACFPIGANFHSWQVAAVTGMDIGFKSMVNGARMTALTCLKFLTDPSLVENAKAEFDRCMVGKIYSPMIPEVIEYPAWGE